MEIRSLDKTSFDTIFEAFNQAFHDYEVQINREQFQSMLKRRGFNPELSFAAFDGDKIIAFTLNGIGIFNDKLTAYDTGTGTLREYRGRGLATQIFEFSIPYLKERGIVQYLLEVLQHNTKAVSVYRNLGFQVSRGFNYFVQKNEEVYNAIEESDAFSIEEINIANYNSIPDFWDFYPSWQNNFESIGRAMERFITLGVFNEKKLIGYCIFESVSGDITQIAVDKQYRRRGVASLLLKAMLKQNKNDTIKAVNTDVLHPSITDFLKAKNIELKGKQFEMIKVV